jgi:hypothetical protein
MIESEDKKLEALQAETMAKEKIALANLNKTQSQHYVPNSWFCFL